MKNFELLSGLKVNYNGYSLIGVNTERNKLLEMAATIGCVIGAVPFNYLGIKVGTSHKIVLAWSDLVHKVKKRIKKWGH